MKRTYALAVVAMVAAAACASSEPGEEHVPTSKGAPTPGQEVFPIVASSEIVVGDNRLQIGLIDTDDAPIRSPKTELRARFIPPGGVEPSSRAIMSFVWTIRPVQGLWVGEATFDETGTWEAVIEVSGGGYDTTARTTFEVKEKAATPEIGEKPPAVDTPTIADTDDLAEITTDTEPSRRFYRLSIAEALRAKRPAVIVFATPKFCSSQVCGPTLSLVKDVAKDFPRITFVHVEPYDLDKVPEELDPVPAVLQWGLPSEPWIFVTDDSGRLTAKYEGSVAPSELRVLLKGL